MRRHSILSDTDWLYLPRGSNFNEMWLFCLFSFFSLLVGIKALFRGPPWKTNGLPLESIWQRELEVARTAEIKKCPRDLCATWFFSTIAERTKGKINNSCRFVNVVLIRSCSLSKWKECGISQKKKIYISFWTLITLCSCAPDFVSSTVCGGLHRVFVCPPFFSCHAPYSSSAFWPLCLFSHKTTWKDKISCLFFVVVFCPRSRKRWTKWQKSYLGILHMLSP